MNNTWRILSIILIGAGVLGLAWGGFDYTRETHEVDIGPLQLQVQEKDRVNIPVWAGVTSLVIGIGILVGTARSR